MICRLRINFHVMLHLRVVAVSSTGRPNIEADNWSGQLRIPISDYELFSIWSKALFHDVFYSK